MGRDAFGIQAKSTGGGGGNGGFSVAGTLSFNKGSSVIDLSLGGFGGEGDVGGTVIVNNDGIVETQGSGAHGVVAQSFGGGGGNGGFSAAGGLSIGGKTEKDKSLNVAAALGGFGGDGNMGGLVNVTNTDRITTLNDNAHAIFAQSIGGGGGSGGNSITAAVGLGGISKGKVINTSVAVGGFGGEGNTGNTVTIVNGGVIDTTGVGSHGIYAQSIGGGGGDGGNANGLSLILDKKCGLPKVCKKQANADNNVNLNVTVGGFGGKAAHGAAVDITNTGGITTRGAASNAIFAQSIGGGGGNGGNGTIGLGGMTDKAWLDKVLTTPENATIPYSQVGYFKNWTIAVGGDGGSSGDGGKVTVTNSGDITTYGAAQALVEGEFVSRQPEGGYGIVAQSIGGGGGYGVERSEFGAGGDATIGALGKLALGGGGGSAGDGGEILVTQDGNMTTSGHGAHAIIAQSIGGGGGIAGDVNRFKKEIFGYEINTGINLALAQPGGNGGDGDIVTVNMSGDIATSGEGAFGIVAQSVGGGGGLAGSPGLEYTGITLPAGLFFGSVGGDGSGGTVAVTHAGNIDVSGPWATGIFAQSAGGTGTGGDIEIAVTGNIRARNANANAIMAESVGNAGVGNINVKIVDGFVEGGSASGAGVKFSGGGNNTLQNRGIVGSVEGMSGMAILGTTGNETIENFGIIIGSVDLGTGDNTFNVRNTAAVYSGNFIRLGTDQAMLTNAGGMSPGGKDRILTSSITGSLLQTESGHYDVDVDLGDGSGDRVDVSGGAEMYGKVVANPQNKGLARPGTRTTTILTAADRVADMGVALDYEQSMVVTYALDFPTDQTVTLSTTVRLYARWHESQPHGHRRLHKPNPATSWP